MPFLSLIPAKAWLYLILFTALSGTVFAGWRHYTNLVRDNGVLQANLVKMEIASEQQQAAITAMQNGLAEWKIAQAKIIERAAQQREASSRASSEKRRIDEIFSKHDLGKLARSKPDIVERLVNRGSDRIGKLLGCATGDQSKCVSSKH